MLASDHHQVEVNGQNVVGMKDTDILKIIQESARSITLTILPVFVFDHLTKNIGWKDMRANMDRSVPEL